MSPRSLPLRSSFTSLSVVLVSNTRMSVPFSLAVAISVPSAFSASMARAESWAVVNPPLSSVESSTRTTPRCSAGQANTHRELDGLSAKIPNGLNSVLCRMWISSLSNEYTNTALAVATTTLSLLSLTARTSSLNVMSPMTCMVWSSHSFTLFVGKHGVFPPPTSARMLHLNSISTIPIPPLGNLRRKVSLNGSQL
eukprot:gene17466-biopygen17664